MATQKKTTQAVSEPMDENIISSIVINGDISKLTPQQKVDYYRGFCQRLGLDPISQPFKLLRLNGREVLYCDRSGAQQLNKIHQVSHAITARETVSGCYVVTAQASTPDGRRTESIGAVPIENLKGDNLCNAMMKAETKAKRRSTLDLLGLGILDETEADSIPNAIAIQVNPNEPAPQTQPPPPVNKVSSFKRKYESVKDILDVLATAKDIKDIASLYYVNAEIVESTPALKSAFTDKKNEFYHTSTGNVADKRPVRKTVVNPSEISTDDLNGFRDEMDKIRLLPELEAFYNTNASSFDKYAALHNLYCDYYEKLSK